MVPSTICQKRHFQTKVFPTNKQLYEQCICCLNSELLCVFFKTNKYSMTESISDFCNHGNQIKHGNQTMEPSAILHKKKKNDIFKPHYLLTAQVCMNYAYCALIINTFGINLPNCSNLGSIYIVHIHCTLVFVKKRYFHFNMSLFAKSQMKSCLIWLSWLQKSEIADGCLIWLSWLHKSDFFRVILCLF